MKIEIYKEKEEIKEEKVIRLRLVEGINDSITLIVVDKDGNKKYRGNLLAIRPEGKVSKFAGIDKNIGLNLNSDGELIITKCRP